MIAIRTMRRGWSAAAGFLLAGFLLGACGGCGGGGGDVPDLYKVSGTLTHQGKPVPGIEVIFLPDDRTKYRESLGMTDAEGKFKMMYATYEGAPPGGCTVYVRDPASIHGAQSSQDPAYLEVVRTYGDPAASPKKLNIEGDMTGYELKLD